MNNPGWSCPKCGSVYAPWVKRCEECPKAMKPPVLPTGLMRPDPRCGCPTRTDGSQEHTYNCPHFRLKL